MRWLHRLFALALLASPLAIAGCKQGVNERCQVMSDCEDGLSCVLPAGGTAQAGGICLMPGGGADMTSVIPDMAQPEDMTSTSGDAL